jgi:hypothetical protein
MNRRIAYTTGQNEARDGFPRNENRYGVVTPKHRAMNEAYLRGYDSVAKGS